MITGKWFWDHVSGLMIRRGAWDPQDPHQVKNVASDPPAKIAAEMGARLMAQRSRAAGDGTTGDGLAFERPPLAACSRPTAPRKRRMRKKAK